MCEQTYRLVKVVIRNKQCTQPSMTHLLKSASAVKRFVAQSIANMPHITDEQYAQAVSLFDKELRIIFEIE